MIGVPVPAFCTGHPLPPRHLETDRREENEALASHLETDRREENEALASHLERRVATETSIPDVGVPGGGIMLPPGTAKRHRRSPSGDDRARWKDRKEQRHRQSSSGDDRAWWKAWKAMIRRFRPRPFTWNGGRPQKRPFPRSEFQVEAICFHPERPIGTGGPPAATTVPGGRTERNKGTGSPPAATTVPGGRTEKSKRKRDRLALSLTVSNTLLKSKLT